MMLLLYYQYSSIAYRDHEGFLQGGLKISEYEVYWQTDFLTINNLVRAWKFSDNHFLLKQYTLVLKKKQKKKTSI